MSAQSRPPDRILVASEAVTCLQGVELLGEWVWYHRQSRWARKCRLSIKSANHNLVPDETDWYILADAAYPNNDVDLVPAKEGGITCTFQHQYYNGVGEGDVPWRGGLICAKTPMFSLRKRAYDREPFEVEKRLAWHLCRAREWLQHAADGALAEEGEPFELPDYNCLSSPFTVAYCESSETLTTWTERIGEHGVVLLGALRRPRDTYVLLSFNDRENKVILEPPWNAHVRNLIMDVSAGTWTLLPNTIVLPPWQAPMTWGELGRAAESQGVDYAGLLARLIWPFTWDGLHFVLLGSCMPAVIGGKPHRVHWQALRFRRTDDARGTGSQRRTHPMLLWQKSQNWHPDDTLNRGAFGAWIRSARVLLVGAGAIGSMVSEILVRGGAQNLTVIDPEKTEIGNLARHTLTMDGVDTPKAEALVSRLSGISPHVAVRGFHCTLEQFVERQKELLCEHSIVMDCTGSDDVLSSLEECTWSRVSLFCSISVGLQARRLYVLTARKDRFPRAFFLRHVEKWLREDAKQYDDTPFPRSGGMGCWHPAFPARVDDMWLFSAAATKYIDRYIMANRKDSRLAVFEQVMGEGSFGGVRIVAEESDNG
jgi:hypothetical protein